MIQIFQLNILCYEFAIQWLLCCRKVRQHMHGIGCKSARAKNGWMLGRIKRSRRCSIVEKVNVQIVQPKIRCYKYDIQWLLCCRTAQQQKHGKGCESAQAKKGWMSGRIQGCGGCSVVEKAMIQIFQLNTLCYKYTIMWLLCLRRVRQYQHNKRCESALAKNGWM